jgi:hypothetical protein
MQVLGTITRRLYLNPGRGTVLSLPQTWRGGRVTDEADMHRLAVRTGVLKVARHAQVEGELGSSSSRPRLVAAHGPRLGRILVQPEVGAGPG